MVSLFTFEANSLDFCLHIGLLVKANFENELQKPMKLCLLLTFFVSSLSFKHVFFGQFCTSVYLPVTLQKNWLPWKS